MGFEPTSRRLLAGTQRGLYVSADNGKTWLATAVQSAVKMIVVSPKSTILAVVQGHGLYASKNHGQTWSLLRAGNFGIVAVDQNSTIYWLQTNSDQVSSDEGATWHNLPTITYYPPRVSSGAVTLDNANVTVAGPGDLIVLSGQNLFEYTAGSSAWSPVGPPITKGSALSMAIVPSQPRKFLVSTTAGGVLMSDDTGWTHITDGFGGARANDVAVVASNPSIAVAATDGGLFRTDDHGTDCRGREECSISVAGVRPELAQGPPEKRDRGDDRLQQPLRGRETLLWRFVRGGVRMLAERCQYGRGQLRRSIWFARDDPIANRHERASIGLMISTARLNAVSSFSESGMPACAM